MERPPTHSLRLSELINLDKETVRNKAKQNSVALTASVSNIYKEMIQKPSSTMDKIRVYHDLLGHVPMYQRFFLLESLEMQFLSVGF